MGVVLPTIEVPMESSDFHHHPCNDRLSLRCSPPVASWPGPRWQSGHSGQALGGVCFPHTLRNPLQTGIGLVTLFIQ